MGGGVLQAHRLILLWWNVLARARLSARAADAIGVTTTNGLRKVTVPNRAPTQAKRPL